MKKKITILSISLITLSCLCLPTKSQVIPDNTLDAENSTVNSTVINDVPSKRIDGGAIRGTNLFHSFEAFNVDEGLGVYFSNPAVIENIISRVTGNNPSEILGTLGVLGNANLFLINPNGIIFGSNASLNVNGSFIGSSASSVIYDGFEFTANNPQAPPLLTINIPIGLGFGDNPGTIVNQSRVSEIVTDSNGQVIGEDLVGLRVDPQKTLALVGGDISIAGSFLTVQGGRIELGSVAGNSRVGLIPKETGWELSYEEVESFQDISVSDSAFIANAGETDDIQIQGKNITLTEGSAIFSENQGGANAGNLIVKASESLELIGGIRFDNEFFSSNLNIQTTSGESGNLSIETKNLILRDGAQILANTFGDGNAANINILASESIELIGTEETGEISSGIFAQVSPTATGNGGNIEIETNTLTIKDGAQIAAGTFSTGNAGDINIDASSIEIKGTGLQETISSGIFANVEREATGEGGNIDIDTDSLVLRDGAQIAAGTFSTGNAGNVNIDAVDSIELTGTSSTLGTERSSGIFVSTQSEPTVTGNVGELNITTNFLTVEEGARISANNSGTGESGNATLNVDKLVVKDGGLVGAASLLGENSSNNELGNGGTLTINANSVEVIGSKIIAGEEVNSSLFTLAEGTGNAGNLNIFTNSLAVNGAEVNVSAEGTGAAGNLTIEAETIALDNGTLTANTVEGNGGNINLDTNNLLLQNGNGQALISTDAESTDGGNIFLTTDNLVALDNSDITANAGRGRGGRVSIDAEGIFGIEAREEQTPKSDITATSDLGVQFSGDVTINTPEIDLESGLNELPTVPIDADTLIAQNLCNLEEGRIAGGSSFTIIGRGGLPPSADDPLINKTRIVNWATPPTLPSSGTTEETEPEVRETIEEKQSTQPVIQQAQGWAKTKDGKIVLTANAPIIVPQTGEIGYPSCGAKE